MGEAAAKGRVAALACLCALFAPVQVGAQAAASFGPDVIGVVAGEKRAADALTFIGASGQLYFASGDTWKRRHIGGIASTVLGAVRAGNELYAISEAGPLFRWSDGLWQAVRLGNSGDMEFSSAGARVVMALGRHIYELDDKQWKRLATAERQVTALFAPTSSRLIVATTRGRLRRLDGRNLSVIKNDLPSEDHVVQLVGGSSQDLVFGLSRSGVLFAIGTDEAKPLVLEGALAGAELQAFGVGPGGAALAAGVIPGAIPRSVLIELRPDGAREFAGLPPLAPGDRFTVIHTARDGALVVATYGGLVLIRRGDAWAERRISGEVPPATSMPGPGSRPAPSP